MSASSFPPDIALWSFTAVVYDKADSLSLFFALSGLVPGGLIVLLGSFCAFAPKNCDTLTAVSGVLATLVGSAVSKAFIRQPRPQPLGFELGRRDDYGMPSMHSAVMGYFFGCVFILCCCRSHTCSILFNNQARRHGESNVSHFPVKHENKRVLKLKSILCVTRMFIISVLTLIVAAGRVYGGFHTVSQVVCGVLFGFCISFLIFFCNFLRPLLNTITDFLLSPLFNFVHRILTD